MSWFIPLLIGLLLVYLVMRFTPRSKVDVKDKYVFITGCDSGFGRATAIRLDKMGACVLATCLTQEGEQSLKSVTSNKLKTFQMDVTKSQQIKEVYAEVQREIPYGKGKPKCSSCITMFVSFSVILSSVSRSTRIGIEFVIQASNLLQKAIQVEFPNLNDVLKCRKREKNSKFSNPYREMLSCLFVSLLALISACLF